MNTSKDNKWRNGKALERYTLIAPLLEGSLDPAKRLCWPMKLLSKKRDFPD